MLRGHKDLKVFQLAYQIAMKIFEESKGFPKEERYSLRDQIRRSSRSVAANIAESYRRRRYPAMFISRIVDADAEATETQVWLDFAYDCGYISEKSRDSLTRSYEEVGKMLGSILSTPEKFVGGVKR